MQIRKNGTVKVSRSLGGNITMVLFLALFGLFMVLPLIYTVLCAFKPMNELYLYPPRFFVRNPTWNNFYTMFKLISESRVPFERYLLNSLLTAGGGTVLYIVLSGMAAYPLAKFHFKGKFLIFNIVIWAMLFRTEVTAVPQYILISKLHLLNNYLAIILPALAGSMGVFLMRQFMISFIPDSLIEAARIDGAGEFTIFWRLVMPMVRPAWLTLAIFSFQGLWNITGTQFIYNEEMKMLPIALQQISTAGLARAGAASAISLFLMLPPIILFLICQSSVMETMSTSGIK